MKRYQKILLAIGAVAVIAVTSLGVVSQRKISTSEAAAHFEDLLQKQPFEKDFTGVQWAIESEDSTLNWQGARGTSEGKALEAETPFHAASIGKLMTSVLVYQAVEQGDLKLEDTIASYLPADQLKNLFVVGGKDYSREVTVEQLLSHTSGVAGYYDDPVTQGKTMAEILKTEPERLWKPDQLIAFTADNQTSVGKPGETFHYSDTGFVLLGKILEKVEGSPYHVLLQERLFAPLGMTHTTALFDDKQHFLYTGPMADIWLNGSNMLRQNGLSVGWAGGGIVTTLSDLLTFSKYLHGGKLITQAHYEHLFNGKNSFRQGIHYGAGGMTLHFDEFFFLLKGLPTMNGHIGSLSTHLFYDPTTKTHIVMNFGSASKMTDSFKVLIDMMMTLQKIK